jgi:hypothetical protein
MKCQDTNIFIGKNAWTHVIEVALPLPVFATSQVASIRQSFDVMLWGHCNTAADFTPVFCFVITCYSFL